MKLFNDFFVFLSRVILLYVVFGLCRICFYLFNSELIGAISWSELPMLVKGAFVFDSVSIFYLNLPFLVLSLAPFHFRRAEWYQRMLLILFVTINAMGLVVNMADVFYFPFKLARIASDDLHLTSEGNFGGLLLQFAKDYWYGYLIYIGFVVLLWWWGRKIPYRASEAKRPVTYYLSQTLILVFSVAVSLVLIRGGNIDKASYPISVSDASMYAEPQKTALVLSNPFALIRTMGQRDKASFTTYFEEDSLEQIFTPIHAPKADSSAAVMLPEHPNIVLIIMESFASSHIKELSDQFAADAPSYTPFLDSLIRQGYIFREAFHNGLRSIDALPSLWASIPSFKTQFLSLPQSSAPFHSLPMVLREMGYSTAFMHGAVHESMSFYAFGKSSGVEHFWMREEYEKERGSDGFDGTWGIFDHKFFPYVAEKMATLPQPFFATLFTLSSHHPYTIPDGYKNRFPKGTMPIHEAIGYSDQALREFFEKMSREPWFDNTLFIITADHGSGADNEKYRKVPYNYAVPLLFYTPNGSLKGSDSHPAQHIDLMPTILGMLKYEKPYFAFGEDLFAADSTRRAINYVGGTFNTITDKYVWQFNEHELLGVYQRADALQANNLIEKFRGTDAADLQWTKAFIQQYYAHIQKRQFTVKNREK